MTRVRLLVIDDSATSRTALRAALSDDPVLEVVGEAADGTTAQRLIDRLTPDLITMDVFLRAENGLDLAASIMQANPTPIVMVTAADVRDPTLAFRALQVGALDVCAKLPAPTHPDYATRRKQLVRVLKSLAAVPVVHRSHTVAIPARAQRPSLRAPRTRLASATGPGSHPMLVIGASTGGPPVLSKLLRALPAPFPLPICIVQHMTRDFVPGFARWIAEDTGLPVSLVSDRAAAQSGVVYIPVADHHLLLESRARLTASAAGPNGPYRPSIDVFFESVARTDAAGSIGVLLTGMGSDGAQGLAKLRAAGARTLVQEPDSCAVAGMPSRAIALGAAEQILHPDALPAAIVACAAQAAASRARL